MAYAFIASDWSLKTSSQVTAEDYASRSVVVKNLSPATKAEDVTIHFQRRRNGGGEVECVRLLKEGTAVVTFETSEVAVSVLERQHKIEGSLVTLELYRHSIPDQVFGMVSGRLDSKIFGESNSTMKTILQTIQDETEVDWKETFDGFVVSGTFEQIKSVNDILKTKLKEKFQSNVFHSQAIGHPTQRRKSSTEQKKLPTFVSKKLQAKTNKGYRKVKCDTYLKESDLATNIPIPEAQVIGDSVPNSEYSTDPSKLVFSVAEKAREKQNKSYRAVKRFNACHKENEVNASISISENEPKVVLDTLPFSKSKVSYVGTNNTNDKTQNHEETKQYCDAKIIVNSTEQDKIKPNNLNSQLRHEIPENKSNARDWQSKPKSLDVIKTEDKSNSILPAFSQEQIEKSKTVECNTNSAVLLNGKQEHSIVGGSYHKFVTVTGLAVILLKGDITSQEVDVLLNPINPTLSCEKGLSKQIVEKGGQAIIDEYLSMTQNQAPTKDSYTFITAGGNLPCRSVLHAVLPSWNNEKQDEKKCKREMHRCLKEGLILSSGYRHKSIALPPLGQDWNDIPVEVSVEVIVRVIASFGKIVGPIHSGINEFHIVCEDDTTINAFLKDISSFSFQSEPPFFASVSSKNNLNAEQTGAHLASQTMIRNDIADEIGDSSMPKESYVEQIQKAPATPKYASVNGMTHADGPRSTTHVSASYSSETTVENEKTPAGYSATDIHSSSQCYSTSHQNQVNQDSRRNKDSTPSDEKQAWEKTVSQVSSSAVELIDVIKTEDKSNSILPACSQEQVEKPKTVGCNTNSAVLLNGKQEHSIVRGSYHKFVTVTGIAVILLKGDITSQEVDVLLNPINPTLSCEKGLSKQIVEKGGQAIKDEYLSMTQNQAPTKDSYTFITAGGNLPCRSVLHAVLPSWNNEKQDEKKCKREMHRCLKEGLILSSGYRHKSIALPPLGQDWNDIPVEVSVEVIVRVIAAFGRNVGPLHSGINEFRIVCEDDTTIDAFLKDISSFSFQSEPPFFAKSNLNAEQTGAHLASQSMMRNDNANEIGDSSMRKDSYVEQVQKAPAAPKYASVNGVTHADGPRSTTQVSASHSSETTVENENTPADYSATEIRYSSHFYSTSHQNQVNQDSKNGRNKDSTPSDEKQAWEKTISHVSSSAVERIDVVEIKAFEMLQVTSAVQLEEERMKSMVVQDGSHLAGCQSSDLFVGDRLNLNREKKKAGRGRYKSSQKTVVTITKEMAHDIQQPQVKDFLPRKEQNGGSRENDHSSFSSPCALNSGPHVNKSGTLLITSPTVDGLLKADIRPSLQSLQLWHEEHLEDRFRRSENAEDTQDDSKGNTSFLSIQELEENSRETSGAEFILRKRMPFEKAVIKEKEQEESVKKDGLVETQKNGDKVVDGDHPGSKPNVSERDVSILCALCKDRVDHPELTHPNVCMKHKFCDDCIINAFTISSNCPACMDAAGLITTDKETVNHNQHIHHSSSPSSSYHRNQDDKSPWTSSPDLTRGNQPPGQMMWKRYEASLPGFQGYGTIAATFIFYDGIQGLEHPNPGGIYKGTSCVAYIPETLEGKQVLKLLRKSFDARLVFTVLSSAADGVGYVTLNDIELKTTFEKDSRNGYPDEGYLSRLRSQLAAKGIC